MPIPHERPLARGGSRWFVRFRQGGKQTSLVFATEAEAQQFCHDIDQRGPDWAMDNYNATLADEAEMTLSQWAERHFASMPQVSPATLEEYRRDWTKRWEPLLGHYKLSRITREHLTAAVTAQTGSDKTIENAWGTLATMLRMAVIDGHLDKSPALGVRLGRRTQHEKTEHRYLTPDEILQVVVDTSERYQPLVWTLAGTGMRWGEATAVTVGDVNLSARTLRVNKAWKRNRETGWYVGPTKTDKSRRTIALMPETVVALERLVKGRGRGELLFTNRSGDPIRHSTFYREHWAKACTRNIPEPRPRIHDLRHSHVAILLSQGVSLPVIQARLGHEKIATTIDTYGHLMPDMHIGAADALSRAFANARPLTALEPPAPPSLDQLGRDVQLDR